MCGNPRPSHVVVFTSLAGVHADDEAERTDMIAD